MALLNRVRVTTRPGQGRGRRLVTRGGPPYPFKGCSNWLPIGLPPASGHAHVAGLYLETLFSFSLCLVSGCAVPARSYPTGNVRPHIRARSQPRIRGRPTTYLCLLLWSPRDITPPSGRDPLGLPPGQRVRKLHRPSRSQADTQPAVCRVARHSSSSE